MRSKIGRGRWWIAPVLVLGVLLPVHHSQAAVTMTVEYSADPTDGFNSVAAPDALSTAPGATLGAQRKASFEAAVNKWGANLTSNVPIVIKPVMQTIAGCTNTGGTLGFAGAAAGASNWVAGPGGAAPPFAGTTYPIPLANKIANTDLSPGHDINATLNLDIGTGGCLMCCPWHYALDLSVTAPRTSFYSTVFHEIAHGLGFSSQADAATGAFLGGQPGVFDQFLEDHSISKMWPVMTDAERMTSTIDTNDLHWTGPAVTAAKALLLGKVLDSGVSGGHVEMYAPAPFQPGSSVSHWDTDVTQTGIHEVMQPADNPPQALILTDELFNDIGWGAVVPVELEQFSIE